MKEDVRAAKTERRPLLRESQFPAKLNTDVRAGPFEHRQLDAGLEERTFLVGEVALPVAPPGDRRELD
ncbi:MAG: hypothetical protein M3Q20_06240, partial [Actinomycetota bacterium]|nr:hypothetical protein [Actinomycetota bacterium]